MRPPPIAVLVVGWVACWLGGCVTVSPWEREVLARQDMKLGAGSESEAGETHLAETREGASGGMGGSGGGCGCN